MQLVIINVLYFRIKMDLISLCIEYGPIVFIVTTCSYV